MVRDTLAVFASLSVILVQLGRPALSWHEHAYELLARVGKLTATPIKPRLSDEHDAAVLGRVTMCF
jgi:hypothetical protein